MHGAHVGIAGICGSADAGNLCGLGAESLLAKHGAGLAPASGGVAGHRYDIGDLAVGEDDIDLDISVASVVRNVGAVERAGDSRTATRA